MASLLELPREIRDMIMMYCLWQESTVPANPSVVGPRSRDRDIMWHDTEDRLPMARWPQIALVNRQLREEVLDIADKCWASLPARLDLLANGYLIYPTWQSMFLPTLRRGLPSNVCVNLRIFTTESFRPHNTWPRPQGIGFRSLLAIFTRLCRDGPLGIGPPPVPYQPPPFAIDLLSIDVTFHDVYTPDTHHPTAEAIFRYLQHFAHVGLLYPNIQKVRARASFQTNGKSSEILQEWHVAGPDVADALNGGPKLKFR